MEMSEMEFTCISQETADELCKAFEDFLKTAEETHGMVDKFFGNCLRDAQMKATEKYLHYIEKYVNATFLTRWYWLRKARKMNEALLEVVRMNNEHFARRSGDDEG